MAGVVLARGASAGVVSLREVVVPSSRTRETRSLQPPLSWSSFQQLCTRRGRARTWSRTPLSRENAHIVRANAKKVVATSEVDEQEIINKSYDLEEPEEEDAGIQAVDEDSHSEHERLLKEIAEAIRDELRGTCIFLIGMMGSGKTTVGRVLAQFLGYHFFDSDDLVEQAARGASVTEIFDESDEEGFREAETEVLRQLSAMGRLIVATGGGAVVRPENWGYLRHGIIVWLDVPLEVLAKRVVAVGTHSRPLLASGCAPHEVVAELSKLYEDRNGAYANADAAVSMQGIAAELGFEDPSRIPPTMVALQVLKEIQHLMRKKKKGY